MLVTELETYIKTQHEGFLIEIASLDKSLVHTTKEDKWSAVEIIDHVTLVELQVNTELGKSSARNNGNRKKTIIDFDVDIVLSNLDYEVIIKVDAFPNSEPDNRISLDAALARFAEVRKTTLANLENGKYINMKPFSFPHQVFGNLNFYNWLYFLGKHEEMHLEQLKRNIKALM